MYSGDADRPVISRLSSVTATVSSVVVGDCRWRRAPRWRPTCWPAFGTEQLAGCQSFFCALSANLRAAPLIAPLALPTAF